MKKFFFDCGTRDVTASIGILVLRVMIGLMMFFGHGLPKISKFAALKEKFYVPDFSPLKYMEPWMSLVLCITAEVGAALLIVVGLATRPAAFILGICMVTAAFGAMAAAPWFPSPPDVLQTKELALLYLVAMIVLILTGGGSYSLDSVFYKEKRRRW